MRSNQLDHTAVICPGKCVLFNSPETSISASEFQHVVWLILTLINLTPTTTDKIQQQQQQQQTSPRRRGNKRAQTTCLRRLGCFVGLSPHQPAAPHSPHPSLAWTRPTKAHEG